MFVLRELVRTHVILAPGARGREGPSSSCRTTSSGKLRGPVANYGPPVANYGSPVANYGPQVKKVNQPKLDTVNDSLHHTTHKLISEMSSIV